MSEVLTPPSTQIRTSHALVIRAGLRTIGAVFQWSVQRSINMRDQFEINLFNPGLPADMVPGNNTTRTIQLQRYDLYASVIEDVFGTAELVELSDQIRPLSFMEVWASPPIESVNILGVDVAGSAQQFATDFANALGANTSVVGRRMYEYRGCRFTDIGREASANGDRIMMANATVRYQHRVRVQ